MNLQFLHLNLECTKGVITVSATTFQKALLAGCNECGIRPDYIVNVPDIGSFPFRCNNLFFSKSKFVSSHKKLTLSHTRKWHKLISDEPN